MATLQTVSLPATPAAGSPMPGVMHCATGTYTFAANPTAADIVELCVLPAGARIVGGFIYSQDLDTGTETLDIDIGWTANGGSGTYDAADPDGLGNLGGVEAELVQSPQSAVDTERLVGVELVDDRQFLPQPPVRRLDRERGLHRVDAVGQ